MVLGGAFHADKEPLKYSTQKMHKVNLEQRLTSEVETSNLLEAKKLDFCCGILGNLKSLETVESNLFPTRSLVGSQSMLYNCIYLLNH